MSPPRSREHPVGRVCAEAREGCFAGYFCRTAPEAGMAGLKNGQLLDAAEAGGFQVLITLDRGIRHQHNLAGREIAVILIRARSNRFADGEPSLTEVRLALQFIAPGSHVQIG